MTKMFYRCYKSIVHAHFHTFNKTKESKFLADHIWVMCDSSCSKFYRPIRHRDKNLSRKNCFWAEQIFSLFFMAGFNFESGGRRCIRPILEKYQSGKSRYFIAWSFYKLVFLFWQRWKRRIHCENKRRELYDFKLSLGTDGIFIRPETRKASSK